MLQTKLSASLRLSLFAALLWCGGTALRAADPWQSGPSGSNAVCRDGRLTLTPPPEPWRRALAYGNTPVDFRAEGGFKLRLRLSARNTVKGESGKTINWIGLTNDPAASSLQENPGFIGIALTIEPEKRQLCAALARKETHGNNPRIRGDQHGNVVHFGRWPGTVVPLPEGSFELELTFTAQRVSATIPGSQYREESRVDLSPELWPKAWLAVQCMNSNSGRGALTVEVLSSQPDLGRTGKIVPLNLRAWANMGFRDDRDGDRRGGWTDQGNNDLRHLTPGRRLLNGIPFDLIDPASNGGKSCLMLYSRNKEYFPRQIGPVPVGRRAAGLIFLHGAAWAAHPGEPAAVYQVHYADGTRAEIPIKVGSQVADWWKLGPLADRNAAVFLKVRSDRSATGEVGLCAARWINPHPEKVIQSLTFRSAEANPVLGLVAVSLVPEDLGRDGEAQLRAAFRPTLEVDFKRNPPDAKNVPDQVVLRQPMKFDDRAFSVAGSYRGGDGGEATLNMPGFADFLKEFGGISRFPYGLDISFYFWPWQVKDWYPALGRKGGNYGTICKWYYKWGKPDLTLSYQTMLEQYRRMGLKMILLFNCHSMFDGKDFVYVKTLPEEKMRRLNPLEGGKFNPENLARIVANNATLVDYIIKNGYTDTVSAWEMDNERWDMKGGEYAEVVAAHVRMLRAKLPQAKVIVCLGELASYSPNPNGVHAIVWSKELLAGLRDRGMNGKIDFFAPHLYPFLKDNADEITRNHLADYSVRNIYRSLDYLTGLLDHYGFRASRFYVSEWGVQSDHLGDDSRNELLNSMAAAIATTKDMMAIYSHPRVAGSTLHTFLHASYVSREQNKKLSRWGCQSVFIDANRKRFIGTPLSEAVKLFIRFTAGATLTPGTPALPAGVHCLRADAPGEQRYLVVNSTPTAVSFPLKGTSERLTIAAPEVTATSVRKYHTYGDRPGEVSEIVPRRFNDLQLPPYSINLINRKDN